MRFFMYTALVISSWAFTNCNNKDKDCIQTSWYEDADNDGLGDPANSLLSCKQPTGYVDNSNDTDIFNAENLVIPNTGYASPSTYTGLSLIWSDEFNDNTLDRSKWAYQLGDGCPVICGWGNNQLQDYREENLTLQDGNLIITVKKLSEDSFTSSRITSQGNFSFTYGRVDIRAALPEGQGIWPALWMLGENIDEVGWPKCGEIDIVEKIGGSANENRIYATLNWDENGTKATNGGQQDMGSSSLKNEYHVYSVVWNSTSISWYIDNMLYHEVDITSSELTEFHKDFHVGINCAVGGNWPGDPDATTPFAQYLLIDYIRVFQ